MTALPPSLGFAILGDLVLSQPGHAIASYRRPAILVSTVPPWRGGRGLNEAAGRLALWGLEMDKGMGAGCGTCTIRARALGVAA